MTVRRRWSGARNRLECCPAGRAGSLAQDPRAGELVCPGAVSAWAGDDDLKRARGRLAQPEVGDGRAVILERLFDECGEVRTCLLYTSDAADDLLCVDLGGRRIIKTKK